MPIIEKHTPGMFCWYELATTDQSGAKSFYTQLFGWHAEDYPMGESQTYTMYRLHERDAAGAYALGKDMLDRGIPSHWMPYVCVDSADATTAKAKELGGAVMMEPFDAMDIGRMAVIADPSGAVFSIWQPMKHTGTGVAMEPGAACWCELHTTDRKKVEAFYTGLFGWDVKASMTEYTEFLLGGQSHAGMMEIQPDWGPVPPNWMTYFMVADCDASVEKAVALGASVTLQPMDIENVGRFAMLADPSGAHFCVIHLQGQ